MVLCKDGFITELLPLPLRLKKTPDNHIFDSVPTKLCKITTYILYYIGGFYAIPSISLAIGEN